MADEGVELLAGVGQEETDQFVPAASEDEVLVVVGHAVGALLAQLLESIHSHLRSELVLQELSIHQFGTHFILNQQNGLDDVVMGEETQSRSLLVYVPHDH